MVTEAVADRRAWTAATVDAPASWYYPLPADCLAVLDRKVQELRREPRPATEVRLSPAECAACARSLQSVHDALENGRGFAIIEGIPLDSQSEPVVRANLKMALAHIS